MLVCVGVGWVCVCVCLIRESAPEPVFKACINSKYHEGPTRKQHHIFCLGMFAV